MLDGEIGCYLSHYNLWQRIVRERIPAALVLEDDAAWDEDFAEVVAKAAACDWEWDLIRLASGIRGRPYRVLGGLYKHFRLVQPPGRQLNTTAYLISLSGANKLARHCHLMHHAIDNVWNDYWNWDGRAYSVFPQLVGTSGAKSTIVPDGYKATFGKSRVGFYGAVRCMFIRQKHKAANRFHRFWIRPKRKLREQV